MLSGEATNTNFLDFGLTRSLFEPMIYRTRGEHANHYIIDAVAWHNNVLDTVICWTNCILDICLGLLFQLLKVPSINHKLSYPEQSRKSMFHEIPSISLPNRKKYQQGTLFFPLIQNKPNRDIYFVFVQILPSLRVIEFSTVLNKI